MKIKDVQPRIIKLNTKPSVFPRTLPFAHFPSLVRIITEITGETETGKLIYGFGESQPTFPYTNETPLSVYETVLNYIKPSLMHKELNSLDDLHKILDLMSPTILNKRQPMVQATIDHALHDLLGQFKEKPIWNLYVQEPTRTELQGIWSTSKDYNKSIKEAIHYSDLGYAIKLKLFGNVEEDINLIEEVLRIRPNIVLCADANESYSPEDAELILKRLNKIKIGDGFFMEEPIKVGKYGRDKLVELIACSPIRIMLDESLYNLEDTLYYINQLELGNIPKNSMMFNIKVSKVGGLYEATKIANISNEHGVGIMVGGMFPSSYGKLINCHLAMIEPNIIFSDGVHPATDYIEDPFINSKYEKMEDGKRNFKTFLSNNGMGVEIDLLKLIQATIPINLPEEYQENIPTSRFM